jgi:uncharacterized NAD-dependent epimerase/dehydratase family protein
MHAAALDPSCRLALFMEGNLSQDFGKMGLGMLRYSRNPIVCVIDSQNAGRDVREVVPSPRGCPVVATIEDAAKLDAQAVVLGIAPHGGKIPSEWFPALDRCVELGMSLVNGLHEPLEPRYSSLRAGQFVWDIRKEPTGVTVSRGATRLLENVRVLTIGTDMSVGKMTAGLEIVRLAREQGCDARFVATGQIGIAISGEGVPLDAVRVDFASGAVEAAVLRHKDADLIVIEGQGSLAHPSSSATLPLIRGGFPNQLVMCHRADQTHLKREPWVKIPPLRNLATLYEDLAEACGAFPRPKTTAVCLNTMMLSEKEAADAVERAQQETGLPATDPVRFGVEPVVRAILLDGKGHNSCK